MRTYLWHICVLLGVCLVPMIVNKWWIF